MPRPCRHATVHLKLPIALGGKDVVTGWVTEENTAFIRVHEQKDLRGRSQFFPGHLVEKVEASGG